MTHADSLTIAGRRIAADAPIYLIAEIGSNHDGDFDKARRMIDIAADSGWDAVKFQLFRAAWLYPAECGVVDTPAGPVDFYDVLAKAELPPTWLAGLRKHAAQAGVHLLCTPFDELMVTPLEDAGIDAYKIASPELNHLPLLARVARTGKPMLCSTGLSTLADIEEALATIETTRAGAELALLQCVTAYPTPVEQSNLGALQTLARSFGVTVGLSDHTLDPIIAPAIARALGACLLEKHVTLDRASPGPDHPYAIEPAEMRALAKTVRELDATPAAARRALVEQRFGVAQVAAAVGHGRKEVMACERPLYPCDKRSIHAIRALRAGDLLSPDAIRILRTERNLRPGLHPRHITDVMGARLTRDVQSGEGIRWEHLLSR